MLWKYFKIVGIVSEKIGKEISEFSILFLASIHSCLQFHWNRKYSSSVVLSLGGPLWLRGMVSICLLRKGKYDWFLHKGLLLDWLIFLLYLLQFVCFLRYFAETTNFLFLNLFLHFLLPLVLKHLRIFITVMQSIFNAF